MIILFVLLTILIISLVIILEVTLGRFFLLHVNNLKEDFKDRDWWQVFIDVVLIITLITIMISVLSLIFIL